MKRSFLSGQYCSEICLGTLGLAGGYGPVQAEVSRETIRSAVNSGVCIIDTADIYGKGLAESLIGQTVPSNEDVTIVTKIGRDWYFGNGKKNWDIKYLDYAIHQSLKRLNRGQLDVCLLHNPDAEVISQASLLNFLESQKRKGFVKHWGVSVDGVDEAIISLRYEVFEVIQIYANIAEPETINNLLPHLSRNIDIMVRMPLAGGILTGKYPCGYRFEEDDYRSMRGQPWIDSMLNYANTNFKGMTMSERVRAAIKFILDYSKVTTVVCGMKSPTQVSDLFNSVYS